MHDVVIEFPRNLSSYPAIPQQPLLDVLQSRIDIEPFNLIATVIFFLAVIHTFVASRFTAAAHAVQHRHAERMAAQGRPDWRRPAALLPTHADAELAAPAPRPPNDQARASESAA